MKVFLDACCLGRCTDDQSQRRVREEAEAVERILSKVRRGFVQLISSEALEDEVRRNPSMERRFEAEALLSLALSTVEVDDLIARRASELCEARYSLYDALHLAAAEFKRAARGEGNPRIPVLNPVSWIQEQGL
jgi:predicted nucleic acid-binding protein